MYEHDLEEASHTKKPCTGKSKGYGMGPFATSSSRYISDLLEKYGLGFKPSSPNPFTTDDTKEELEEGRSDFSILPHHGQFDQPSHLYELHGNALQSIDEWLEHVKMRHSKVIGSHTFSDIKGYTVVANVGGEHVHTYHRHGVHGGMGRYRKQAGCLAGRFVMFSAITNQYCALTIPHVLLFPLFLFLFVCRLSRALRSLKPTEAFLVTFTIGAGIGALARILILFFVLIRRSHQHLNSPPALSDHRRSNDEERDATLPAYSEVVKEKGEEASEIVPEKAP